MYEKAVEDADKAVELDESNVKAIFRRGTANLKLQNYEAAVRDFEKASHLYFLRRRSDPAQGLPNNSAFLWCFYWFPCLVMDLGH